MLSRKTTIAEVGEVLKKAKTAKKLRRRETKDWLASRYATPEQIIEAVRKFGNACTESLLKSTFLFDEYFLASEHYRAASVRLKNGGLSCGCSLCQAVAPGLLVKPEKQISPKEEFAVKVTPEGNIITIREEESSEEELTKPKAARKKLKDLASKKKRSGIRQA